MKRRYYDMAFAQASIRMFMGNIVLRYSQMENLSERDTRKVDKIFNFMLERGWGINSTFMTSLSDKQKLVMLCKTYGNSEYKVRDLMSNKAFDEDCFKALLETYEADRNGKLEVRRLWWGSAQKIISCEYMPEERLRELAKSDEKYTRAAVAMNPSCPVDVLETLADDKDMIVRIYVAKNERTPEEILRKLANDSGREVRRAVSTNKSITEDIIRIVFDINDYDICLHVVKKTNCPSDILEKLASYVNRDSYRAYHIRMAVAEHPNVTEEVYEILKNEKDPSYRQIAYVCKMCPMEELYNFNPKLKLAKHVAHHIIKRDDISFEMIKFFLDNMGANIRAIVISEVDIPREYLAVNYYDSRSKEVLIEMARKKLIDDNDALFAIIKRYTEGDKDYEICSLATSCLGPGSSTRFIEYLKRKPEYWEHHLKTYLGYSRCTEVDMWNVFNEFKDVRANEKFPLAEGMLNAIRCRKDLSEKSIDLFIKFVSEGNGISNCADTMRSIGACDNFYSPALLNMCMTEIKKANTKEAC